MQRFLAFWRRNWHRSIIVRVVKQYRVLFGKAVCVVAFSTLFFAGFDGITWRENLIVIVAAMIASWLLYYKSAQLLGNLFLYSASSSLGFAFANMWSRDGYISLTAFKGLVYSALENTKELTIAYLVIMVIFFFYGLCSLISLIFSRTNKMSSQASLTHEQKHALTRLSEYVQTVNIIGLCGKWGTGKTFIVDRFIESNEAMYEFIQIGVLSCHVDEIQGILLHEVDKMLMRNGIFSKHSKIFGDVIGRTGVWSKFRPLFLEETDSFGRTLENMRKSVELSRKRLVIVYEDIDRISDGKVINKIFSISETISCKYIKVIYQYDKAELKKRFEGAGGDFLEKFIPHTIDLLPLDFVSAVDCLMGEYGDSEIVKLAREVGEEAEKESIEFKGASAFYILADEKQKFLFGLEPNEATDDWITTTVKLSSISMRRVKHYLQDVLHLLAIDAEYRYYTTTTITTVFVRHFYNDIYENMLQHGGIGDFRLLDALKFTKSDGTEKPVCEYITEYIELQKVARSMSIAHNESATAALEGYLQSKRQNIQTIAGSSPENKKIAEVLCLYQHCRAISESVPPESCGIKDEVINRLLRCTTRHHAIVSLFREKGIISKANTRGKDNSFELLATFRGDGTYKGEGNLISSDFDVFRVFYYANSSPHDWLELVRAFRGLKDKELKAAEVSVDENKKREERFNRLIDIMSLCRIESGFKDTYFEIVSWFNETVVRVWPNGSHRSALSEDYITSSCFASNILKFLDILRLYDHIHENTRINASQKFNDVLQNVRKNTVNVSDIRVALNLFVGSLLDRKSDVDKEKFDTLYAFATYNIELLPQATRTL